MAAEEGARTIGSRQLWLLGGRLVAATLLLGGNLIAGPRSGTMTHDAVRVLIAATFAFSLGVAVTLARTRNADWVGWLQIGWDLALVTGLVYLFGGATSQFSFLFGVVILAAALAMGPRETQLTAGAAIVLYAAIGLSLASGWLPTLPDVPPRDVDEQDLALSLLRNVVGLVLVSLLASALAERLRRTGGQLREAAQSAAGHARFNEDLMRSLASGLLTVDAEGEVRRINPAGAALLGGTADDITGTDARDLLPLRDSLIDGERGEGDATRLDGSTFPVGFSCSPLRDADDQVLGTLVLFQDLTELNQLRDLAERAERLAALGRLSAGLAHEIRNPLGSIAGSVELVMEAPGIDAEDKRLLELVLGETDRLNDLVTTMLDVGRPREPELVSVDLGALATEVAGLAKGKAKVHVEAPSDPVRVSADPAQMRQVLWNLVKNALQFSPPSGEVHVQVGWDDASRPIVSVRDEGPGIRPEDRAHLFDMFFSKRHHGVGLGLALVRQIVEAHRGEITVESEPGEGSTFTVHLRPAETVDEREPASL